MVLLLHYYHGHDCLDSFRLDHHEQDLILLMDMRKYDSVYIQYSFLLLYLLDELDLIYFLLYWLHGWDHQFELRCFEKKLLHRFHHYLNYFHNRQLPHCYCCPFDNFYLFYGFYLAQIFIVQI